MQSAYRWWKDWGTWLVAAPVVAMLVLPPPSPGAGQVTLAHATPYIAFLTISLAGFVLPWRASRGADRHSAVGFSWRAGTVGYGVLFLGDVLYAASILWRSPVLQAIAGGLFALIFLIFVWVLLRALRRITRSVGIRLAIDLTSVAVTGAILFWYLKQEAAMWGVHDPAVVLTAAGLPVGNLAMIVVTGLTLFEVHSDRCDRPLVLIALSNLFFLLANLGFSHDIVINAGLGGLAAAGPTAGLASLAARLLVALAALDAHQQSATGKQKPISRGFALWIGNVLPYTSLVVCALFMVAIFQRSGMDLMPFIVGTGVLLVLLFIRQHVVLSENITLASESLQLARNLHRSEARFRSVVQNFADIVCIVDAKGQVIYVSPAVTTVLGYGENELVGMRVDEFVHLDDLQMARNTFWQLMEGSGESPRIAVRVLHRNSGFRHMEVAVNNLVDDPAVEGMVFSLRDVTDRVMLEEQLKHQAFHDPLTGLANRALLRDRIGRALARSLHHGDDLAVFLLDLDGFKVVNDTRGHGAGDRLLSAVSRRLAGEFRTVDTVARLGGDEFAVLVEGVGAAQAADIAERMLGVLQAPFKVGGKEQVIGVSIGIALGPAPGQTIDDLLRNADLAMYQAKATGKGCYRFFEQCMYAAMVSRVDLETDLRSALNAGEFELHYQPTVAVETGEIHGLEALLRWHHPRRGLVPPVQFIPLTEELGLIVPLGRWVLEQACRQTRQWQEQLPSRRPLTISVNLSVRQLHDARLADDVEQILQETQLPPSSLVLEITESTFLEATDQIMATMRQLRDLGVRLAVDDFGTGFSSLAYLKQFPLDVLKIDQSFIRSLGADGRDHDLVRGILELARVLRMETVAEGVEHEQQRDTLRSLGCDLAQGYCFSRPQPSAEIGVLLAARQRL